MDRAKLDHWFEQGIFWLAAAILIFAPLATGAVRTLEFLVVQALTIAILVIWLARFWLRGNDRILWPPICWAVLAFLGYAFYRYGQADLEYIARGELVRIVVYAFLFLAILDNLNRQEAVQSIVFILVFLGMAISFYAVYQFVVDSNRVWHFIRPAGYAGRGSGTFICPNNLAGFLEIILPLGLAYTLASRVKPTAKVFLGYASIAIIVGIGMTLSRGGWMAAGISLLALLAILFSTRGYRLPALVFAVLLICGAAFFYNRAHQPQARVQKTFLGEKGDINDIRVVLWESAIQMWHDHFWFGVGPAHFDYRFPAYRHKIVQLRPDRVHNDYLNTLADWGTVGGGIVAAAWLLLYWGAFKTWKFVRRSNDIATKPSNRSSLVLGASIGLFALLLHSVVDFNMHIPANAILAIALMALLTGHVRYATERYWVSRTIPLRIVFSIMLIWGIAFLAYHGTAKAREYVFLDQVEQFDASLKKLFGQLQEVETAEPVDWNRFDNVSEDIRKTQRLQLEVLRQAHAVEPNNFATIYRIGESLRTDERYREALGWFALGMKLNPWDCYNYLRYGMCLDRLDRQAEGDRYFKRAIELDPNNYFVAALQGWHFVQKDDYAEAKRWFQRSLELSDWRYNEIASKYMAIVERELQKRAQLPAKS
jgi:O-antigen ligase